MPKDSLVECTVCGKQERLSFARSLRTGWAKCHGYTMRLVSTQADIAEATTKALGKTEKGGADVGISFV